MEKFTSDLDPEKQGVTLPAKLSAKELAACNEQDRRENSGIEMKRTNGRAGGSSK